MKLEFQIFYDENNEIKNDKVFDRIFVVIPSLKNPQENKRYLYTFHVPFSNDSRIIEEITEETELESIEINSDIELTSITDVKDFYHKNLSSRFFFRNGSLDSYVNEKIDVSKFEFELKSYNMEIKRQLVDSIKESILISGNVKKFPTIINIPFFLDDEEQFDIDFILNQMNLKEIPFEKKFIIGDLLGCSECPNHWEDEKNHTCTLYYQLEEIDSSAFLHCPIDGESHPRNAVRGFWNSGFELLNDYLIFIEIFMKSSWAIPLQFENPTLFAEIKDVLSMERDITPRVETVEKDYLNSMNKLKKEYDNKMKTLEKISSVK